MCASQVTGSAPVAEKVQERGAAALAFDYRMWGFTAGEPRHVIEPEPQLQDLRSVIDHVVNTEGFGGLVNPEDIHLFGTSYAGGHVLVAAAQFAEERNARLLRSVRTITSVVPLLDGKAQLRKALQVSLSGVAEHLLNGTCQLALCSHPDKRIRAACNLRSTVRFCRLMFRNAHRSCRL